MLSYPKRGCGVPATLAFAKRLFSDLRYAGTVDLYQTSHRSDWPAVLFIALACRLSGAPLRLHDYCFSSPALSRRRALLNSLCPNRVVGDERLIDDTEATGAVSCRIDLTDLAPYRLFRKERAVPHVIVYGDTEDRKSSFLINHVVEAVRRKYPRGRFTFVSFTDEFSLIGNNGQWSVAVVSSETELQNIYREGDVLLLLTPGGLSRHLVRRAVTAGYPLITNGFDYVSGGDNLRSAVRVIRDSYSALAEAIIRLTDDDEYYRRMG